jgi:uncharacterized protein (TIGR02270 family)
MAQFSPLILEQLKYDVNFAWYLISRAVQSPMYSAYSIGRLKRRLQGYLAVLELADQNNAQPLGQIALKDRGGISTYCWLGVKSHKPDDWQQAIDAVCDEPGSDALAAALSCFAVEELADILGVIAFNENVWLRRAALKYSQLKAVKLSSAYFTEKISGRDEPEVIIALQTLAHQPSQVSCDLNAVTLKTPAVEFAKLNVGYCQQLLSDAALTQALEPFLRPDSPFFREAAALYFDCASIAQGQTWLSQLLSQGISARLKIHALGVSGMPAVVPSLLEYLQEPEWAALAAQALSQITGLNMSRQRYCTNLKQETLPDSQQQQNLLEWHELTFNQKLKLDPHTQFYEEDLPYPNVKTIQAWWQENNPTWPLGTQYCSGEPRNSHGLKRVVQSGNQLQRQLAAMLLKRIHPDHFMVATV